MKNIYKIIALLLLMTALSTSTFAHPVPDEISFLDYSGVISNGVKDYVKTKNEVLFEKTEARIIFVTTDSTDGMDINTYTKNLYSAWNLNRFGRGNSILTVICPTTDEYSVTQGKNIKRVLTDTVLYEIISAEFEPQFASGDYNRAILNFYNALGRWYEEKYTDLDLSLDDKYHRYITKKVSKDYDNDATNILAWIAGIVGFIMVVIFFRIKRHSDFKTRQYERKIRRKKSKADIDKIVNS